MQRTWQKEFHSFQPEYDGAFIIQIGARGFFDPEGSAGNYVLPSK